MKGQHTSTTDLLAALLFRLLHKQDAKQELVCLACQDQDKTRYINLLLRQESIVVLFAFLQVLNRVVNYIARDLALA